MADEPIFRDDGRATIGFVDDWPHAVAETSFERYHAQSGASCLVVWLTLRRHDAPPGPVYRLGSAREP